VSTAGSRHLAASAQWLAAQDDQAAVACEVSVPDSARCSLAEAAAAHDGQPVGAWVILLRAMFANPEVKD
jgi:hypothetical protein